MLEFLVQSNTIKIENDFYYVNIKYLLPKMDNVLLSLVLKTTIKIAQFFET